jgi:WD40 repeat protein
MKEFYIITENIKIPTANTDDDKSAFYITCHLCNNIAIAPRMCTNCESLFCLECIDKHFQDSRLCPNCKEFSYKMAKPNKTIQKLYKNIKIVCPACEESVYYTEILIHINQCKKIQRKAVCNYCKYTDSIEKLEDHKCEEALSPIKLNKSSFEEAILNKLTILSNKIEELTENLESKEKKIKALEREFKDYKHSNSEKLARLKRRLEEKEAVLNKLELRTVKESSNVSENEDEREVEQFDNISFGAKAKDKVKSKVGAVIEASNNKLMKQEDSPVKHEYKVVQEKTITDTKRKKSFTIKDKLEVMKDIETNHTDLSKYKAKESDSSAIKQMDNDGGKSVDAQCEYDGIVKKSSSKNVVKQYNKIGLDFSTLQGHTNGVYCLIQILWDKDKTTIASGSEDNSIIIWNTDSVHNSRVLNGHIGSVRCLAYIKWEKDQSTIASGSDDNTIRIWDIETEQTIKTLRGHTNGVHSLLLREDQTEQHILISGGGLFDSTIRLWNLETEQCFRIIKGHIGCVRCLINLNSPDTLVSSSDDGTLRVWDLTSTQCVGVLNGHTNGVHCVIPMNWDINKSTIISGSWDNTIRVWDIEKDTCAVLLGHSNGVNCLIQLLWKRDMQTILSGSWDKTIRMWNVASEQCLKVVTGHTGSVKCLLQLNIDYEEPVVISGSYDKTLRIWGEDLSI